MFKVVIFSDWSSLTYSDEGRGKITDAFDWVIANKADIALVCSQGNLTVDRSPTNTSFISTQFGRLVTEGIPFTIAFGDSDMTTGRDYSWVDSTFPGSMFTGSPGYVGGYTADGHNNQTYFEVVRDGRRLLVMSSEWAPTAVHTTHLNAFADAYCSDHPETKVMVGIHALLTCVDATPTAILSGSGDMPGYDQGPNVLTCAQFNSGVLMRGTGAGRNVRAAYCGHQNTATRFTAVLGQVNATFGNTVTAMLQTSEFVTGAPIIVRVLTFDGANDVEVSLYDPNTDTEYTGTDDLFTISADDFWSPTLLEGEPLTFVDSFTTATAHFKTELEGVPLTFADTFSIPVCHPRALYEGVPLVFTDFFSLAVLRITSRQASQLIARFPQFADSDSILVEYALADASFYVGEEWGTQEERGRSLLAAHYLSTLYSAGGTCGASAPVMSRQVGDVQVSYAVGISTFGKEVDLAATKYGQEFMRLRRALFAGPVMV